MIIVKIVGTGAHCKSSLKQVIISNGRLIVPTVDQSIDRAVGRWVNKDYNLMFSYVHTRKKIIWGVSAEKQNHNKVINIGDMTLSDLRQQNIIDVIEFYMRALLISQISIIVG